MYFAIDPNIIGHLDHEPLLRLLPQLFTTVSAAISSNQDPGDARTALMNGDEKASRYPLRLQLKARRRRMAGNMVQAWDSPCAAFQACPRTAYMVGLRCVRRVYDLAAGGAPADAGLAMG